MISWYVILIHPRLNTLPSYHSGVVVDCTAVGCTSFSTDRCLFFFSALLSSCDFLFLPGGISTLVSKFTPTPLYPWYRATSRCYWWSNQCVVNADPYAAQGFDIVLLFGDCSRKCSCKLVDELMLLLCYLLLVFLHLLATHRLNLRHSVCRFKTLPLWCTSSCRFGIFYHPQLLCAERDCMSVYFMCGRPLVLSNHDQVIKETAGLHIDHHMLLLIDIRYCDVVF